MDPDFRIRGPEVRSPDPQKSGGLDNPGQMGTLYSEKYWLSLCNTIIGRTDM